MPKLISFCGDYNNKDVVSRLIYYCYNSKFCMSHYIDRSALILSSMRDVIEQMISVQNYFNKTNGKTMAHFVISFNDKSSRNLTLIFEDAYHISNIISDYIGTKFQNIFFVHVGSESKEINPIYRGLYSPQINKDNLHVHFAVNKISYIDGSKFIENANNYYEIINFIRERVSILDDRYKTLEWSYAFSNVFLDDDSRFM